MDEILYNVIWKSSDAAVVWCGLATLANFCRGDSEEANSYADILCQDQRLSMDSGANMAKWAENPAILAEACKSHHECDVPTERRCPRNFC